MTSHSDEGLYSPYSYVLDAHTDTHTGDGDTLSAHVRFVTRDLERAKSTFESSCACHDTVRLEMLRQEPDDPYPLVIDVRIGGLKK